MTNARAVSAPQTPETAALLEVHGLGVQYRLDGACIPAVSGVSFRLDAGESLALVGGSGSGKSSTALALLGLLPPNATATGSVRLRGRELLNAAPAALRPLRGRDMAVVFQDPSTALNPVYPVGFQIAEALQAHHGISEAAAARRALELLALVGMAEPDRVYRSYPHQLSGGQRQRALIAQAVSCGPDLLIADEPTAALDVTVQAEILDLLRSLHQRLGTALLLITHDLGVVADLADRVLVLEGGRPVEDGTVREVFSHPRHAYTRNLLASVPRLGDAGAVPGGNLGHAVPAAPSETETPVVRAFGLDVEYPRRGRIPPFRAVSAATLEIGPGEVVGLAGESGCGKTTFARALAGLVPVAAGGLLVLGRELADIRPAELREMRRGIGYVFQDPASALNPRWPVGASIAEPLELAGVDRRARDRRTADLLDDVELPRTLLNRYPHELSGGQQQRVAIARALALKPALLIADEPTSALDVPVQARVLELLRQLQARQRFACLFISHDLAVLGAVADRIAVMSRGSIVEQGTAGQVLHWPRHPYTRRLLAAVPVVDPEAQERRRSARRLQPEHPAGPSEHGRGSS